MLIKKFISVGGQENGIDLLGRVKSFVQIPKCSIDTRILEIYKETGVFEALKLDTYFKQSVGASYDKVQYLPAILDDSLAWPKIKKYFPRERDIDLEAWELTKIWAIEHLSCLGVSRTIKDEKLQELLLEEDLSGSTGVCYDYKDKFEFVQKRMDVYFNCKKQFKDSPASPMRIFIKEELREGVKVLEEPSSRVIFGESVILFIASFQLFKNLQDKFISNRELLWSSCGLDFSGKEYCRTIAKFKGKLVNSVDGSAFDSNMNVQDMIDSFEILTNLIDSRDKCGSFYDALAYIISNEIFSLCVLPSGEVLFKGCGNPSGSYLTLFRNTVHNFRLYAYVHIMACKELGIAPSYHLYKKKHFALMNGDDCLITSSKLMNWGFINKYMSNFLSLTSIEIDGKREIPLEFAEYCGVKPFYSSDYGQYIPIRNSYKLLLSLLFLNEDDDLLECRIHGLLNANPFDGAYADLLIYILDRLHMPVPDIVHIRRRYLLKS